MEVLEAIQTRRSIRSFLDKPVPAEMLTEVLKAAMLAPSAGNQQPWHFIVVTDREKMSKVPLFHPFAKMITKAPAAIVVCGEKEGKKWPTFWNQDCSAACQNILIAARGLGLGTVWTGVYPEQDRMAGARKLFSIPDSIIPFAIIPIGWPAGEFKPADRYRPELVHHNGW